jgi:hypothetical protein
MRAKPRGAEDLQPSIYLLLLLLSTGLKTDSLMQHILIFRSDEGPSFAQRASLIGRWR